MVYNISDKLKKKGYFDMKYYSFMFCYERIPACLSNFCEALKRIGEINPFNIQRVTIKRLVRRNAVELTDNYFLKRGILNVRFYLNKHLGKSGKYSNRMVLKSAQLYCYESKQEGVVDIQTILPVKEFLKIVEATYTLLRQNDLNFCNHLLSIQSKDVDFYGKKANKSKELKTICPIQTNIVLFSKMKKDIKAIMMFQEEIKKKAGVL